MRVLNFSTRLSSNTLIVLVALFVTLGSNLTFFANILKTYPPSGASAPHLASLALVVLAVNAILFAVFCHGRLTKPVLILFLLLTSLAAYFMDSYGVIINDEMLRNAAQTNAAETLDLMTAKLLAYVACLGILPALLVARIPLRWRGWRRELRARAALLAILVTGIVAVGTPFSGFYASFVREHKVLRGYANPTYFIYSGVKFANEAFAMNKTTALTVVGADAHIPPTDTERELIILVVGETARADRFSINGYGRETTPYLRDARAISFTNFWACGTSTAVSLPCMFSTEGMDKFDLKSAGSRENLLDVLRHAGVNVLWLDNNSDSKGVALRTSYQNYKTRENNPVCDEECRDEGMLLNLQGYIDSHPTGDIFIVLHQMGNHGPAYFKRYPQRFEKYLPVCKNNDLSQCTNEEIGNAYDNAILYTDYFLGRTIELLKRNDARFETALFYVSDHGESLGENGIYLHGLPRAIAPDNQLRVPAIIWLGSSFHDVNASDLQKKRDTHYTHDNIVHTVLGFMEIETELYRPKLDILQGSRRPDAN